MNGRWRRPSLALLVTAMVLLPLVLAACGATSSGPTLKVLAGSEIRDMEPILADMQRDTGVRLDIEYLGTLEGAERIAAGDPAALAWFSHAKYLSLLPETAKRIVAQERIMLSPVVLGVKQRLAQAWGWEDDPNVTWRDIAEKAASGELRYAMTNPAASNTGFTALMGVAAAFAGSADALDAGDIDQPALVRFFSGQALTAGSSGFLADAYVREQDSLDGIINYESVLLSLDRSSTLHEPLDLIYPREGIVTADYPLLLLDRGQRDAYDKVVAWLRTPAAQQRIMDTTLRRPAIPDIAPSDAFPDDLLVELPFPGNLEVIDALLYAYLDQIRRPASAVFVLDVSGSMAGGRLQQLQSALDGLTGTDPSLTGRFARFRAREQVTLITFNGGIVDERAFTIDDTDPDGASMQDIRGFVDGLAADGGTGIYSALQRAYDVVQAAVSADPDRLYSVVLMTDGENNEGISIDDLLADLAARPEAVQQVRTFAVRFGEADLKDLTRIADATGGRVFVAGQDDLRQVFKQIRGYQ